MFNFIIKPSSIVIDTFTYIEEVHDLYAPDLASRFVPKWWKDLATNYQANLQFPQVEFATAKKCIGIIETYKNGFILPLWSDLAINVMSTGDDRRYSYMFADQESTANHHNPEQFGNFVDPSKLQHLKLGSPWKFKEKSGVTFSLNQPTWNLQNHIVDFTIIPGLSDFKYQNSTNIQMLLHYPPSNTTKHLLIEAGTPMYHIIPMSDKKVTIKKHLVSREEWDSMGNALIKFSGSYKARKDKMNDSESKCPFSRMFK